MDRDDLLECSICDWMGCEADCRQVDFDDEPGGFACPKCGEPCAHLPIDEITPDMVSACLRYAERTAKE